MKRLIIRTILVVICVCYLQLFSSAQGKFAGSMKQYMGKSYSDEKHIPWLKSYDYEGGSIISPTDDATQFCSFLYKKGNSLVVLFTKGESGSSLVARSPGERERNIGGNGKNPLPT